MLKSGIYKRANGEMFDIYEVDETGYYRYDILKQGGEFLVDVDAVLYSIVRRRKSMEYGDRKLYEEIQDFIQKSSCVQTTLNKESEWKNGQNIQTILKENTNNNYYNRMILVNGTFDSDTTVMDGVSYSTNCIDKVFGVKVNPLNFFEYEEIELKSNSDEKINTPYYPLERLRKDYKIAHIDKKNYRVVKSILEADARLKEWVENDSLIKGFDTETTGVDVDRYGADKLVGIILGADEDTATYFPFRHTEFDNLPMYYIKIIVEACNAQWERLVAHNKKFDIKVMLKEGYKIRIKWDTMLMSVILNPVQRVRGAHALKELIEKLLGLKFLELDDIFVSPKLINFAVLPEDITKIYACPDGTNVIVLFKHLFKLIPKEQYSLLELECDLADLKAEQEYYGIRVDVKKFNESYQNCNYVIDVLMRAFKELTHVESGINSPDVIRDLMYNKMHCKVLLRTKTGRASTSAAAIKKLAAIRHENNGDAKIPDLKDMNGKVIIKGIDLANAKYPALLVLDKYREYNKRKTAFYARFERTMRTGRIFFWINQNGAESGRQSSPMHQLPKELKAVILSDHDDSALYGPDYSQVELRMIAYLAGETELIKMCCDPYNDIHRAIGSLISGKEMWEITSEERSVGKRRNFGVVYLISAYGLAGQIFGPGYSPEQVKFCEAQLKAFYKRFKRINRYIEGNKDFVQKHGYMKTKNFKRIRKFDDIFDPDITSRQRSSLIRQANNMPVQGTAADLMKQAEVNMYDYIREKGWDAINPATDLPFVRPMLSIHDEMLISADKSIIIEEIITMIRECMEIHIEGAPPFFVQPAVMDNWEGHSNDSLAIPIPLRDKLIADYKDTGVSRINYENYKTVLNDYRDEELKEYMAGLIQEHGLDYTVTGKFVRHQSLTHDLLGRFYETLSKMSNYDEMSQAELVDEATRLYIDNLDKSTFVINLNERKDEDKDSITEVEDVVFEGKLDTLVNFDATGNITYDYEPEVEEDEYSVWDYAENEEHKLGTDKIYRVWKTLNCLVLDFSYVDLKDAQKVINEVYKYRETDGFYPVKILYAGELRDAGFSVEDLPDEEISAMIEQFEVVTN